MQKLNKNNESGRSMVEMLGVLAIMGILSIGSVSLLRYALEMHEANEVVSELRHQLMVHSTELLTGSRKDKLIDEHIFEPQEYKYEKYGYSFYPDDDNDKWWVVYISGKEDENDCSMSTSLARKVIKHLMSDALYVWEVGSYHPSGSQYPYYSMDEFEEVADFNKSDLPEDDEHYCPYVKIREDLLERPSSQLKSVGYNDWQNPLSCASYEGNPCVTCRENGGWPVHLGKRIGADCVTADGLSNGYCTADFTCYDPCEKIDCPMGASCRKGICFCEDGSRPCGNNGCCPSGTMCIKTGNTYACQNPCNDVSCSTGTSCNNGFCYCSSGSTPCGTNGCCPEGTVCGATSSSDKTYACLVPTGTGCLTNDDCNDTNKYCRLRGYNYAPTKGTCENKNPLITVSYSRPLYTTNTSMNYWSAQNFCKSHGKKMTNLVSLGLSKTATPDPENIKHLGMVFKEAGVCGTAGRWYWMGDLRSSTNAYNVCICQDGKEDRLSIGKSGGYGGIQDSWFPLCED